MWPSSPAHTITLTLCRNYVGFIPESIENYQKSKLNISDQVNEESEINKAEYNIFKFNEKLFEILNENADYKNCMDTLEVAIKKLPPLL